MAYENTFGLLRINTSTGSFGGGGSGRRGGFDSANVQGWADDGNISENSSIGQSQRDRAERESQAKMEDQARHIYNKTQKDADAWKSLSSEQQQQKLDQYMKEGKIVDPSKHSSDVANERRNEEQQKRNDAREAVREYVKDQEKKAKDSNQPWTHDKAEDARRKARENQEKGLNADGTKTDDESKAKTLEKASSAEAAGSGGVSSLQGQITALAARVTRNEEDIAALQGYRF